MEGEQQQQQAKRRRRPSVRLGEIGFAVPFEASSLWIEAPRQRRKSAPADVLTTGKKAPRIRPLEQLGRAEEEEWAVIEPTNGSPVKGKSSRRVFNRKVNTKLRGKARLGWTSTSTLKDEDVARDLAEGGEEEDENESEEKEILPLQGDDEAPIVSTSSESEELLGSDLKGEEEENLPAEDSGNAGSDGSEEGEPGVKPSSHGDEMQGAIEDGPGGVNGKVFSRGKQQLGERRSGRQAAIRAIRDMGREIASRDAAIVSRDAASRDTAGEPSGRFQSPAAVGNGANTVVTPNSSQRGGLAGGVSGWLQELGLGRYLELFELNEVDTEVLPHLTFEDLREMGVDAVGARRKMFNGIQELGQIRGI
ncbi:hypothetical protein M758_5G096100 [Ceratodon purpureus]|uniref:SAM domain-containing protein n=1 Tax=Ceratodon purpureus TaxID=3225 RepID=A0A8T0I3D7_CERPU|nr:hypothetical protein KC19_5G135200 [Ceratodon purpureus]KAG0616176.1 hypothetical protein M758_5G096100 [Ceratodon purpureus]